MNRSIEAIPTWSLCYIINGDASGLTDEEIRMVDEAMRKNNIEIVSPRYNEDMCTRCILDLLSQYCSCAWLRPPYGFPRQSVRLHRR